MDWHGWGLLHDQQYLVAVMSQHDGSLKVELPRIYGRRPATSAWLVILFDGSYTAESQAHRKTTPSSTIR